MHEYLSTLCMDIKYYKAYQVTTSNQASKKETIIDELVGTRDLRALWIGRVIVARVLAQAKNGEEVFWEDKFHGASIVSFFFGVMDQLSKKY